MVNKNGQIAEPKKKMSVTLRFKLAVLLGVILFVVYANTLKNDFAFDDYLVIKENAFVNKGFAGIPRILSTSYHAGFHSTANDLYRPLSLVVFAVLHQFFGDEPAVFHLLNILLFAGCVVLLFLFLDALFEPVNAPEQAGKRTVVAFIAAALFAVHPIHTEVVANCKSADELLCFLFAFISLLNFLKYAGSGKINRLLMGAGTFLLSFLAKETAVTFLAVVPLVFFFYRNENKKRSAWIALCVVLMAGIAIAIRLMVLNRGNAAISGISFIDNPLVYKDLSLESRIATAVLILGYYVKLLFVPYPLVYDYSFNSIPFTHFSDPWVLLSAGIYAFLVFACVKSLLANRKDIPAFGILFYLITIALFSNIFFLVGSDLGERFLFFPSVGFCVAAAFFIEKLAAQATTVNAGKMLQPRVLVVLIPVCLIYGWLTMIRNNDWKDNLTLFKADLEKLPDNCRLYFFLGNELTYGIDNDVRDNPTQKQQLEEGIAYLGKAIAIYPDYVEAHVEMGRACYFAGRYDQAELHEQKALQLEPGHINAANNLGAVYIARQQYAQAITLFTQVTAWAPDNTFAHFNLACAYASTGNYDAATAGFKKTIELDPHYHNNRPYAYLARIYKKTGKPDSAQIYETQIPAR